jgi:hypothetical protein
MEMGVILSSKVFLPFGKVAAIDNGTFRKLIRMQNEYLQKIKHIEIHNMRNINEEIVMGYDTTDEVLNSTIRQILMDEVDVEGDPNFQAIECTMTKDMDRTIFTEPNQDLCKHILDDIETWMEHKFEHSDDPKAYHENDNVKIFATTTDKGRTNKK